MLRIADSIGFYAVRVLCVEESLIEKRDEAMK